LFENAALVKVCLLERDPAEIRFRMFAAKSSGEKVGNLAHTGVAWLPTFAATRSYEK